MGKFPKEKMSQAIACLACTVVLWLYLDEFGKVATSTPSKCIAAASKPIE